MKIFVITLLIASNIVFGKNTFLDDSNYQTFNQLQFSENSQNNNINHIYIINNFSVFDIYQFDNKTNSNHINEKIFTKNYTKNETIFTTNYIVYNYHYFDTINKFEDTNSIKNSIFKFSVGNTNVTNLNLYNYFNIHYYNNSLDKLPTILNLEMR